MTLSKNYYGSLSNKTNGYELSHSCTTFTGVFCKWIFLMGSSFIVNLICLGRCLDFTIFGSSGFGSKESSAMNEMI